MRHKLIFAALSGCAALAAGSALAAPTSPPPTDIEALEVVADLDIRVAVAVGGDLGKATFVTNTPGDMRCGGAAHEFVMRGERQQCWTRVRRDRQTIFAAQSDGHYGVDWRVDWTGCDPISNGAACQLTPRGDATVVALFVRLPQGG